MTQICNVYGGPGITEVTYKGRRSCTLRGVLVPDRIGSERETDRVRFYFPRVICREDFYDLSSIGYTSPESY